MSSRILMVSRMDPASAEVVAQLFREHDESDLPGQFGVRSRTLLHYHGLTMHLIQAEQDVFEDVARLHGDPSFQELNRKLGPHMRPLVDRWRGPQDSRAVEFYHRQWG